MLPKLFAVFLLIGTLTPSPHPRIHAEPGIREPLIAMVATLKPIQALQALPVVALADFPTAPAGTYTNAYEAGNCTAYVASRIHVPDSWGNANTWALGAEANGVTVSSEPLVGSIAQTSSGTWGHVAIVTSVGDGTVTVSEANVLGLGVVDTNTYPVSTFVYIYI